MPRSHLKRPPTDLECRIWRQNKLINPKKPINPQSNYSINANSPIYKELDEECKKFPLDTIEKEKIPLPQAKKKTYLSKPLTKEWCIQWNQNKLKNPMTNHRISEKSNIYKEYANECPALLSKTFLKSSSKSSSSSSTSKSLSSTSKTSKSSSRRMIDEKQYDDIDQYYPDINDPHFRDKLMALTEINVHRINKYNDINTIDDFEKKANELCSGFDFCYQSLHLQK